MTALRRSLARLTGLWLCLLPACSGGPAAKSPAADGALRAKAGNPIITHVFTADPSAAVYDGRVYVFTSHDLDDQTNYDMTDYHAFSSDDMVNWQDHGVILDAADVSWADKLYAPDTCEANGKYYLYFPNSGVSIGVAVAERPEGPYRDALGRPLIDANTPGVSGVEWIFDPTCFVDDDGQAYLYFGGGPKGTGARVIRLGPDMISTLDPAATTIAAPDYFEAPYLHKRQGKYYYSYSTGFGNHPAYIDYMISDNPVDGFQYQGTVLANPEGNRDNNNHHSFVEYAGEWYVFYHNRVLAGRRGKGVYQRSITVDRLTYDASGRMNPVSTRQGDVFQLKPVEADRRIEAESFAAESGVETQNIVTNGKKTGVQLTQLNHGDWVGVSQVNFGDGKTRLTARASSGAGATIEVYQGGCEGFRGPGKLAGKCVVPPSAHAWTDVSCDIALAGGIHDLCLRFTGGDGDLMNLDHYTFQ